MDNARILPESSSEYQRLRAPQLDSYRDDVLDGLEHGIVMAYGIVSWNFHGKIFRSQLGRFLSKAGFSI